MSQSDSFRSTFDQSGDIGHDKSLGTVQVNNAQIRIESCKMIIGNLRFRICYAG